MPEGRAFGLGPKPASVWHNHQQSSGTIENPPAFIKTLPGIMLEFQSMNQQKTVKMDIGKWKI
jgi:hypothetical protein